MRRELSAPDEWKCPSIGKSGQLFLDPSGAKPHRPVGSSLRRTGRSTVIRKRTFVTNMISGPQTIVEAIEADCDSGVCHHEDHASVALVLGRKKWSPERRMRARVVAGVLGTGVVQADRLISRAKRKGWEWDEVDWDQLAGKDLSFQERVGRLEEQLGPTTTGEEERETLEAELAAFEEAIREEERAAALEEAPPRELTLEECQDLLQESRRKDVLRNALRAVPWNPRKIGDFFKGCFREGHEIGVRARYGGEAFPEPVVRIFCKRSMLPQPLRGFWTRVPEDLHEEILDKGSTPLLRKFITVGVPPRDRTSRAQGRTRCGWRVTKGDLILIGGLLAVGAGTLAAIALLKRNPRNAPSGNAQNPL